MRPKDWKKLRMVLVYFFDQVGSDHHRTWHWVEKEHTVPLGELSTDAVLLSSVAQSSVRRMLRQAYERALDSCPKRKLAPKTAEKPTQQLLKSDKNKLAPVTKQAAVNNHIPGKTGKKRSAIEQETLSGGTPRKRLRTNGLPESKELKALVSPKKDASAIKVHPQMRRRRLF